MCYLCGLSVPINVDSLEPIAASRDHVIPKARIRKGNYSQKQLKNNVRLAHRWCNHEKGNRVNPPEVDTYAERLIDAQVEYEVKHGASV